MEHAATEAFQDRMRGNACFGCGPHNTAGLRIKSRWESGGDAAVCVFHPEPHMTAGPPQFLNGGVIATIVDCHSICTAVADAYRREGRNIDEGELIWYVTGKLEVSYRKPVPIDQPVTLRAQVTQAAEKKSVVECEVLSRGTLCATAQLVAVRVSNEWLAGS